MSFSTRRRIEQASRFRVEPLFVRPINVTIASRKLHGTHWIGGSGHLREGRRRASASLFCRRRINGHEPVPLNNLTLIDIVPNVLPIWKITPNRANEPAISRNDVPKRVKSYGVTAGVIQPMDKLIPYPFRCALE